jgi:hypothetical protein
VADARAPPICRKSTTSAVTMCRRERRIKGMMAPGPDTVKLLQANLILRPVLADELLGENSAR